PSQTRVCRGEPRPEPSVLRYYLASAGKISGAPRRPARNSSRPRFLAPSARARSPTRCTFERCWGSFRSPSAPTVFFVQRATASRSRHPLASRPAPTRTARQGQKRDSRLHPRIALVDRPAARLPRIDVPAISAAGTIREVGKLCSVVGVVPIDSVAQASIHFRIEAREGVVPHPANSHAQR